MTDDRQYWVQPIVSRTDIGHGFFKERLACGCVNTARLSEIQLDRMAIWRLPPGTKVDFLKYGRAKKRRCFYHRYAPNKNPVEAARATTLKFARELNDRCIIRAKERGLEFP